MKRSSSYGKVISNAATFKKSFYIISSCNNCFYYCKVLVVPESFGQYGWYRGDSVNELRNLPVNYAGSTSCGGENCHKIIYEYG